jgi:translation initiation factor 1
MAKKDAPPAKADAPFNSPFAALAGKRESLPSGPAAPATVAKALKGPARAVVRYERKGHGGKEATRIEQLGLPAKDMAAWLKEAKQALGCGGTIDGDTLILQGDQRERLTAWLTKKQVGKISVS